MTREDKKYIFRNGHDRAELERLQKIEEACDPHTRRHLLRLGLRRGSRCLEIGPGAGSVMRWMGEVCGPEGHVTAIELNPRFLRGANAGNLTLIEGDAVSVPVEPGSFDIIHARYVLIHIYEHRRLLEKLCRALKPGAWILLEEPDFRSARAYTEREDLAGSFLNVREAIRLMYEAMQLDPSFGARLTERLAESDLAEVDSETVADICPGGSVMARMMAMSTRHLKEKYIATGAVTEKDIENYCLLAADPSLKAVYYSSVSAWGQRPF